ncbi:MAG: hypothetical protein L3J93_02125, partial [Thermoplasmata archaeon]|nr:hypothetical protein [Thermoplasmata archaeon]
LLVDRVPGVNATHFYVQGIEDVRYASIAVAVLENAPWPPPAAMSLHFGTPSVTNATLLVTVVASSATVAVNVTASYVDSNGVLSEYVGLFEFRFAGGLLYAETLAPTLSTVTTTPETSLPISFLLEVGPPGGGP